MSTTPNIIEFCRDELGLALYPVQNFALKLFYGIPLDDQTPTIAMRKHWSDAPTMMTEHAYLLHLHDLGQCNVHNQGRSFNQAVWVFGRRSGLSLMMTVAKLYALYRLQHIEGGFAAYYRLQPTSVVNLVTVTVHRDAVEYMRGDLGSHLDRSKTLRFQVKCSTQSEIQTTGNVRLKWLSHTKPYAMRGRLTAGAYFMDAAYMQDAEFKSAYDALMPSTAALFQKNEDGDSIGENEVKIVTGSTPNLAQGRFYELYDHTLNNAKVFSNWVTLQIPTWEMNPSLSNVGFYEQAEKTDPVGFARDYGAQFQSLEINQSCSS
jgi:hypothetical protein